MTNGQDIGASDYHPQLAIGAADGTCQTTNLLRKARKAGSVVSPPPVLLAIVLMLIFLDSALHVSYHISPGL